MGAGFEVRGGVGDVIEIRISQLCIWGQGGRGVVVEGGVVFGVGWSTVMYLWLGGEQCSQCYGDGSTIAGGDAVWGRRLGSVWW